MFGTCGRRLQTGDSLNLNLEKNPLKKKTKLNSSPERNMEDLENDPYWGNRQLFKGELLNFGVA